MPYNLTHDVWRDAERDFRHTFETYLPVDVTDTRIKARTFDEHVEWLARHIKFASEFAHGRSSMEGMTSRDLAMWYLGGYLQRTVLEKLEVTDDDVKEAAYVRVSNLPPVPCIGPVRVDRRNARKDKKHSVRGEQSGTATTRASLRASIEHRLTVEAREADEALVTHLVAERRRRVKEVKPETSSSFNPPQPLPKKSVRRKQKALPTPVEHAKRETEKAESLRCVEKAQAEHREQEARDDARRAERAAALRTATAIQQGY